MFLALNLPFVLNLVFLGACLVAGLAFIIAGALQVVRAVGRLRKRVAAYADLPIAKELELAEARLAAAERRAATVPALLDRSRAALLEIQAARAQVGVIKTTIVTLLRLSGLVLGGR